MSSATEHAVHRSEQTRVVNGVRWEIETTWCVKEVLSGPVIWAVESFIASPGYYNVIQSEILDQYFAKPFCKLCAHE